jgi:hypothetical protein
MAAVASVLTGQAFGLLEHSEILMPGHHGNIAKDRRPDMRAK